MVLVLKKMEAAAHITIRRKKKTLAGDINIMMIDSKLGSGYDREKTTKARSQNTGYKEYQVIRA